MSPTKRKTAVPPPAAQSTPQAEFERDMLDAARMLGQLMAEALLSCYRTIKCGFRPIPALPQLMGS